MVVCCGWLLVVGCVVVGVGGGVVGVVVVVGVVGVVGVVDVVVVVVVVIPFGCFVIDLAVFFFVFFLYCAVQNS